MPADDKFVELNRRAKEHWDTINGRMLGCLKDLITARIAAADAEEHMKTEPFARWKGYHQHVERAARYAQIAISTRAQLAGRAKRTDALQETILQILRDHPSIDLEGLIKRLEVFGYPIETVGRSEIEFTHKGRAMSAKLSGLKDRLSRARKTMEEM